jgi:hypothetical protein
MGTTQSTLAGDAPDLLDISTTGSARQILALARPVVACKVAAIIVRIKRAGKLNQNPGDPESPNSTARETIKVCRRIVFDPSEELPDVLEDLTDTFVVSDHGVGLFRGPGQVITFPNTLDAVAQPGDRLEVIFEWVGSVGNGIATDFQLLDWPLIAVAGHRA